jgi:hypothetical protein
MEGDAEVSLEEPVAIVESWRTDLTPEGDSERMGLVVSKERRLVRVTTAIAETGYDNLDLGLMRHHQFAVPNPVGYHGNEIPVGPRVDLCNCFDKRENVAQVGGRDYEGVKVRQIYETAQFAEEAKIDPIWAKSP